MSKSDDPTVRNADGMREQETCTVLMSLNATSLDLRPSYVLEMRIGSLRVYQTLLRNRVVIKVAFG